MQRRKIMFCNKCQKNNDYDAIFCKYCGEKMSNAYTQNLETDEPTIERTAQKIIDNIKTYKEVEFFDEFDEATLKEIIRQYSPAVTYEVHFSVLENEKLQVSTSRLSKEHRDKKFNAKLLNELSRLSKYKYDEKYFPYMKQVWRIVSIVYEDKRDRYKNSVIVHLKSIFGYYGDSDEFDKVYNEILKLAREAEDGGWFLADLSNYVSDNKIKIVE